MIKYSLALALFVFSLPSLFSQERVSQDSLKPVIDKMSFLDSIKATFVNYKLSDKADQLWSKELNNLDIYSDLIADIETINPETTVDYELPTDLLKERLRLLDEKSAFNIEYNVGLENIIKSFLKNRRRSYERLMGLSQYYFPVFEEALAKYNIPLEIKYLAVVESALKPKAVSRAGATGLWQFMYHTGKQYKLNIDTYVDERSDLLKSSDAAARYMKGMYEIFNDWDLVLASYNSGAGNVTKAIRRSGGLTNYWNIKKNLPRETQGYVPAFIATMYIFEYHKEHGIKPEKPIINHYETDTIAIRKQMSFKQISDLLDIPVEEIQYLNPSYKRDIVPFITNKINYLRLPVNKVALFTSNEDKMYSYVDYIQGKRERPFVKQFTVKDSTMMASNIANEDQVVTRKTTRRVAKTKYYVVKRGDNLGEIADKNNVTIAELKQWNRLKGSTVQKGKKLRIVYSENIVIVERGKKVKSSEKDALTEVPKQSLLVSTDKINSGNKVTERELIDGKTEVSPEKRGNEDYIVKAGDNLFIIAKENKTTVAELRKLNNLGEEMIVYAGDKLVMPSVITTESIRSIKKPKSKVAKEMTKMYTVKNGDSLYSISQKHNTTIAEIKKLNNIKSENLVPGMKLKING
jgi:membrane-bound lytic murein transglycosylase D